MAHSGKIERGIQTFQKQKITRAGWAKTYCSQTAVYEKMEELIFLYKATLILEFTPTKWKESNIIWIPKPHKDRYNHHKSWRPISLSNYVVKTLEKLITWEVDRVLRENPLSSTWF